jgi:hypothetical protein
VNELLGPVHEKRVAVPMLGLTISILTGSGTRWCTGGSPLAVMSRI